MIVVKFSKLFVLFREILMIKFNKICDMSIGGDPRNSMSAERRPGNMSMPHRPMNLGLDMNQPRKLPQPLLETKTDYGKYR